MNTGNGWNNPVRSFQRQSTPMKWTLSTIVAAVISASSIAVAWSNIRPWFPAPLWYVETQVKLAADSQNMAALMRHEGNLNYQINSLRGQLVQVQIAKEQRPGDIFIAQTIANIQAQIATSERELATVKRQLCLLRGFSGC
jgi:hypothetical protein